MGHLKLTPPFNVVVSPKFAKAQVRAATTDRRERVSHEWARERGAREQGAEDASLAEIAQRFAPGAQAAPMSAASSPSPASGRVSLNTPLGAFKALPPALQGLILALVLIALLPSLTLTALVWLGPAGLPGFAQGQGPSGPGLPGPVKTASVKTASLADLPSAAGDQPPPAPAVETATSGAAVETANAGQATLAAPSMLEAEAGQEAPLAIALASVEPLPIRSVVAVSGLPSGASLSAGRPYTDSEWTLRPEELAGLRLVLPETAQGEARLAIALIATDGATLAEAQTSLKVIAAPASQISAPEAANGANAPHAPSPASLAPAYDPFTVPVIADLAALAPQTLAAPEGLVPETQASGTQAAQTEATATGAEGSEAGEVSAPAESESIASEPASEPSSGPTSAPLASEPGTGPATGPFANNAADAAPSVALSAFVNLRESPSSSSRVIAVMAKGAKVTPTARRRSWLKVTDAATGKTGWIYGRYASAANQGSGRTATPSRLGPGPEESFWTRVGRWIVY